MIERLEVCDIVRLRRAINLESRDGQSDFIIKKGTILVVTNRYSPLDYGVIHQPSGKTFTVQKRMIRKLRPLELLALQAVD